MTDACLGKKGPDPESGPFAFLPGVTPLPRRDMRGKLDKPASAHHMALP